MPENLAIVIGGPTASGKSRLAIDLALAFDGVVVNADASQVYKSIPVISAAPSAEDKQKAPHRLYEYLEDEENGNVVSWLEDAAAEIRKASSAGRTPVVVGGSGLYLDNLINGSTPIPEVDPAVRGEALEIVNGEGVGALFERLSAVDPEGAALVNPADATRVRRAFEIFMTTGLSIAEWFKRPMVKKLPEARFLAIRLLPEKAVLDRRCNLRFDIMTASGALEEVAGLLARQVSESLPVMKAKGVPELAAYLRGETGFEEAAENAKLHTRQYAKRQLTWFRNKLEADVTLPDCYAGQADFINDVKKQYNMLQKFA